MAETRIKITADTAQAERAIGNLDKSLVTLKDQGADVAKALAGITAAAAAMGVAIVKTLGAAGDLVDAATRLGVSAENLNRLQQAALLAGIGADTLNASVQRLSANIGEGLAKGTGPAVDALTKLGLPIQEIARLRPDEQFQRIAERLNAIQNPAERTAAAMSLFGKQGPAILQVANELEKVDRITKDIGFFVGEREIRALDEAGDAIDQLGIIWDAGIKKAVAELAPVVLAIVNRIKEGIKEAGGFEGIWKSITSVLRTIANVMLILAGILTARLVVGAAAFAVQLGRALVTAKGLSLVLSRTPIGLLTAGAAILAEKMGVDLVGAAGDFLDINLDIEGAQQQITDALEESQSALNGNKDAQQGFNETQQKALDTLEKLVATKNNEITALRTSLSVSAEEAAIKKAIGEQQQKLLEANVKLTDSEAQSKLRSFEISVRQEALLKRIVDRQKEVNDAIKGMMDPDESGRIEAWTRLQKANEDYIQSLATGDQVVIESARKQVQALNMAYENQTIKAARSKVERLRIEDEFDKQRQSIEANQRNLIALGFTQEANLYKQLEEEKLRIKGEFNKRSEQMDLERIQRTLMAERSGMAEMLSQQDQAVLAQVGANERQKAIVDERIRFEKQSDLEKSKFAIDNLQSVFSALGAQNKKAFEASKALAIASAVMNTYQGATKALATYPFPFGLIAAAAAVAAGMAQVSAIRSQQYSGRQLGGPVMGGTPYMVGENGPELFTPSTTGSITRNSDLGGGGAVTVNFSIVANDTQGFDELLSSRRGVITQIISDAMLERGSRSMI